MKLSIAVAAALSAVVVQGADPSVSGVSVSQNPETREVRVDYTLAGADAIVTLDVTTNDVSVGAVNLTGLTGDVNCRIAQGTHSILWRPNRTLGVVVGTGVEVKAVVTAWRLDTPPDYMVVNVEAAGQPRYFTSVEAIDGGVTNDLYKTSFMVLRKCPAKNVVWRMGSNAGGYHADDQTAHLVTFTNDYYIAIYPCTQHQFAYVLGTGWRGRAWYNYLSHSDWAVHPMENISYNEVRGSSLGAQWPASDEVDGGSFLKSLRDRTGLRFDLPTEAQWEYACRAGTGTAWNWGAEGADRIGEYAWTAYNAENHTHPVGLLRPNAWGIYDMHGHVWELCRDWYGPYEIPGGGVAAVSPTGPASGTARAMRAGGFTNYDSAQHSAFRNSTDPGSASQYKGFRVVVEVR